MGKNDYKMRTIVCVSCNKTHTGHMPDTRKYCSLECYRNGVRPSRKTGKTIQCTECLSPVYKSKVVMEQSNTHFCSSNCHNTYQARNKVSFICKICNTEFRWSKSRLNSNNPMYCSVECRNKCDEWRSKSCIAANVVQSKKKGLNKLELTGQQILSKCAVLFTEQSLINGKILVDVLLPDIKLIIQWDGDYWHGHHSKIRNGALDCRQQKRTALDKSQDAYLKKCGYDILRFWEHEVNNSPDVVKETILARISYAQRQHNTYNDMFEQENEND